MTSTLDDNLTCDAFLGGQLQVWQPRKGYRAGVDPVLLAACVPAKEGETALELGCGVGVAALCLAARTGVKVTGLEVQSDYAALARRNALANDLPFAVVDGEILDMPANIRAQSFDHVFANPPYYVRQGRSPSPNHGRETALGEGTDLAVWVDAGIRRLKPKGWLTVIQKADRLPDLLKACDSRLGDVTVLPIAPRQGRTAELVVLRARKGARGPFRLCPPFVLHRGEKHQADGDDYSESARAVLREGGGLEAAFGLHR